MNNKLVKSIITLINNGFECDITFETFVPTKKESKRCVLCIVPIIKFYKYGGHTNILKHLIKKKKVSIPKGWKKIKKCDLSKSYSFGLIGDINTIDYSIYKKEIEESINNLYYWVKEYGRIDRLNKLLNNLEVS